MPSRAILWIVSRGICLGIAWLKAGSQGVTCETAEKHNEKAMVTTLADTGQPRRSPQSVLLLSRIPPHRLPALKTNASASHYALLV